MAKVVFITGGAGVFGLELAKVFLRHQYKVCIGDMIKSSDNVELEKTHRKNVMYVPCDVTNSETFEGSLKECIKQFGGLDVICANAGCGDENKWQQMMNVNIGGVMNSIQLGTKLMSKTSNEGLQKGGTILITASQAAVCYLSESPFYTATKHAVLALCKCFAQNKAFSEGTGMKICCVCPPPMRSKLADQVIGTMQDKKNLDALSAIYTNPELVAKVAYDLVENQPNGKSLTVDADGSTEEEFFIDTKDLLQRNLKKLGKI